MCSHEQPERDGLPHSQLFHGLAHGQPKKLRAAGVSCQEFATLRDLASNRTDLTIFAQLLIAAGQGARLDNPDLQVRAVA